MDFATTTPENHFVVNDAKLSTSEAQITSGRGFPHRVYGLFRCKGANFTAMRRQLIVRPLPRTYTILLDFIS